MARLDVIVEALKETNKTVEDTGLFVADYIADELKRTTSALSTSVGSVVSEPQIETVAEDGSKSVVDAIIFSTDYIDDTLTKMCDSIVSAIQVQTLSLEGLSSKVEKTNEDNAGREIEPLTPKTAEEATVEANKSFFGADFGKNFKSIVGKALGGVGKVARGAVGIAAKPLEKIGVFDKLKEVFSRMAEIFVAVGFMKFLDGWQKASKWFGENANFGEKLAAGVAGLLQSFLGLTDEETKKLAQNMALVFGKIFTWLETTFTGLFQGAVDLVMGLFSGDGSRVWEGIKKIFNTLVDSFGEIAKGILNLFMSPETSEAIVGTITKYLKMIPNAIEAVWSGVRSALGSIIDFVNNNVIKYIPKVPYIKNPFAGGGGGGSEATPSSSTPPSASPAEVSKPTSTPEAGKVAAQSTSNVAAKESAPAATSGGNTVTQVNNNSTSNNKAVYGMKFDTKPGIGNSNWAISHAMP